MEEHNNYELKHIQSVLLKAMVAFDEFCRNNDICYSLHGGTLLGAVRNHRFIPWDDDIDVSMRREDFSKFKKISGTLPLNFRFDDETTWVPRLIMKEADEIVCVDILIWDYVSSRKIQQREKFFVEHIFQGMLKRNVDLHDYSFINKCLIFVTAAMGIMIPYKIKLKQYQYVNEKLFCGDRKCIHRANDNYASLCHVFDSEYMDEYIDIEFEKRMFMVNKRYHEFLERSYGKDYLIPPPVEQRIPAHGIIRQIFNDSVDEKDESNCSN